MLAGVAILSVALAAYFSARASAAFAVGSVTAGGAFLVSAAIGAVHRRRAIDSLVNAALAGIAGFALWWIVKNVLGAGWPAVKQFSISPWMALASTVVFGGGRAVRSSAGSPAGQRAERAERAERGFIRRLSSPFSRSATGFGIRL